MHINSFQKTVDLLHRALDVNALRYTVSANNLANAEVPGFKRTSVNFETELKRALDSEKRAKGQFQLEVSEPEFSAVSTLQRQGSAPNGYGRTLFQIILRTLPPPARRRAAISAGAVLFFHSVKKALIGGFLLPILQWIEASAPAYGLSALKKIIPNHALSTIRVILMLFYRDRVRDMSNIQILTS